MIAWRVVLCVVFFGWCCVLVFVCLWYVLGLAEFALELAFAQANSSYTKLNQHGHAKPDASGMPVLV